MVAPTQPLEHGSELQFSDVTLHMHHYGKAHTPSDLCGEEAIEASTTRLRKH